MANTKRFRKSLRKSVGRKKRMTGGSKIAVGGSGRSSLSKTAKSVSSKKVATTEARAVIQAKEAIQDAMLNENPDEEHIFDTWAEEAARNADHLLRYNRFRKWREELYIHPSMHMNGAAADWYRNTGTTQWEYHEKGNSNNKIPEWAQTGRRHPNEGELVEGAAHHLRGSAPR